MLERDGEEKQDKKRKNEGFSSCRDAVHLHEKCNVMSNITLHNPVVSLTPSTSGNNWPADPDHQDMTGMHYAIFFCVLLPTSERILTNERPNDEISPDSRCGFITFHKLV